ncbi:hypothetical protein KCP74_12730 [Salmonella enterica subsp. enterica]|nr:hypothetical protein KCP74_12730 [Salmonella enterica subsp. enterica]
MHRSMFANGLSAIVSGFFGSTPNTPMGKYWRHGDRTRLQYRLSAARRFFAIRSCVGKLAAAIQIIPLPVIGGVSLLLYGVIGASKGFA